MKSFVVPEVANRCLIHTALLSLSLSSTWLTACTASKKNAPYTSIERRSKWIAPYPPHLPFRQIPKGPSFEELKKLALDPVPDPRTQAKINHLFSTPSINNSAWRQGQRPQVSNNAHLGDFLRIASWNIEKSIHAKAAAEALKSEAAFLRHLKPSVLSNPDRLKEALRQRERLITADVLLLQEMDIGLPRSGYLDATREIATALGMNYSYAPQQLEIDPVTLGIEPGASAPDSSRYKGLFGIAVLSRYPIVAASAFQLKSQPYDWYHGELIPPDSVEKVRRLGAKLLFKSHLEREMKIGGRIFFRVDLHIPGLPGEKISIIHNHLEIKTTPRGREEQLKEILSHVHAIPHTVIMAGDHNSALADISPTSLVKLAKQTVQDSQTWVNLATNLIGTNSGVGLVRSTLNATRNLHNPLAFNIPVILPNRARQLFRLIEEYEFEDGGRFDPRGDSERSINGSTGKFGNSNESYFMGLRPTFRVPRPIGPVGRTRLDWIFVKQPASLKGQYQLAPHFGETLETFDTALHSPLSDHRPIVADLPLKEPTLRAPKPVRIRP
jgi:endonuclease/exonuclease/phosphatase family metal-dependent hydrolase